MNSKPCVKCGASDGWDGPKFETYRVGRLIDLQWREVLQFKCRCCGYVRDEPCRDAKELHAEEKPV